MEKTGVYKQLPAAERCQLTATGILQHASKTCRVLHTRRDQPSRQQHGAQMLFQESDAPGPLANGPTSCRSSPNSSWDVLWGGWTGTKKHHLLRVDRGPHPDRHLLHHLFKNRNDHKIWRLGDFVLNMRLSPRGLSWRRLLLCLHLSFLFCQSIQIQY